MYQLYQFGVASLPSDMQSTNIMQYVHDRADYGQMDIPEFAAPLAEA
jgi:hypothetical protein